MDKLRIKTFGYLNPPLDQLSRINSAFLELGHELTDKNCDFLYSNNDRYDDILEFANKQKKRPLIILNVLDIQNNNPNYPLDKVYNQLKQANVITAISQTTQKEIKDIFGLDSYVIYNPVKMIKYKPEIKKEIDFLIVGRNSDPAKNGHIFEELLNLKECAGRSYAIVGPEGLPHVRRGYLGILKDEELEEIYNLSKFIICMSNKEGICLPPLEAMQASCIPIYSNKMTTAWEFAPESFCCNPDAQSIYNKIIQLESNYESFKMLALIKGEFYQNLMSGKTVAKRIIDLYNKYK